VATEREDVKLAVTAGSAKAIRPAPWIEQHVCFLEVGAAPIRNALRRCHESGEPGLLRGVLAIVHIIELKRCSDVLDLNLSGLGSGLPEIAENLRGHKRGNHPQDSQHDE